MRFTLIELESAAEDGQRERFPPVHQVMPQKLHCGLMSNLHGMRLGSRRASIAVSSVGALMLRAMTRPTAYPRRDLLKRPLEAHVDGDHGDEAENEGGDEPKYLGRSPASWSQFSSTAQERHAAQYPLESGRKLRDPPRPRDHRRQPLKDPSTSAPGTRNGLRSSVRLGQDDLHRLSRSYA